MTKCWNMSQTVGRGSCQLSNNLWFVCWFIGATYGSKWRAKPPDPLSAIAVILSGSFRSRWRGGVLRPVKKEQKSHRSLKCFFDDFGNEPIWVGFLSWNTRYIWAGIDLQAGIWAIYLGWYRYESGISPPFDRFSPPLLPRFEQWFAWCHLPGA